MEINNYNTEQAKQDTTSKTIDSYQSFLNYFSIDSKLFLEWGVSSTIFSPIDKVASEWEALKKRLFNNQTVYIRGYGQNAHGTKLYVNFYNVLLNNKNIKKDPSNNAFPQKLMQRTTGLIRNKDIYNYQVSHIWGHTKNAFLFEAPWNICYTPKIMDPFTGHEAKGILTTEYKKLLLAKASELFRPFINEYNQLLVTFDIKKRLQKYILSLTESRSISQKELSQFYKDAVGELSKLSEC